MTGNPRTLDGWPLPGALLAEGGIWSTSWLVDNLGLSCSEPLVLGGELLQLLVRHGLVQPQAGYQVALLRGVANPTQAALDAFWADADVVLARRAEELLTREPGKSESPVPQWTIKDCKFVSRGGGSFATWGKP